jgi:hypothetical protein
MVKALLLVAVLWICTVLAVADNTEPAGGQFYRPYPIGLCVKCRLDLLLLKAR